MKTIPTAKAFLLTRGCQQMRDDEGNKIANFFEDVQPADMIEFAKLHVEAALKAASEKADTQTIHCTHIQVVDKDSILNSYPLENIK